MTFVDATPDFALAEKADLFFLAVPHGNAAPFAVALREDGKTVVDLSADFRTTDPAEYKEYYGHAHPAPALLNEAVYGIPEIHRDRLKTTKLIASPGCFPTSIILPLVPFIKHVDTDSIVVTSLTGVSGAGRKLELRLLFGEINDNMYAYSVPKHRHLGEIEQELSLAAGKKVMITFVPHLVPIHRGMLSTITARLTKSMTDGDAYHMLQKAYGQEPFVEVLPPTQLPEVRPWPIPTAFRFPPASMRAPTGSCSFPPWTILAKAMLHKPFRPQTWRSVWMRGQVWHESREINGSKDNQGRWSHFRCRDSRLPVSPAGSSPAARKTWPLSSRMFPTDTAATFTTNLVKAAPVKVSMRHMRNGKCAAWSSTPAAPMPARASAGIADAKSMVEHCAKELDTKPHEWLVCSTGRIGTAVADAQGEARASRKPPRSSAPRTARKRPRRS